MSSESDSDTGPDLDWKSQEILRAIYKNDGSANTSEIRALTGIDNNDQILYRFREKLTPTGLIELEQPESDTARPEPKMASFTAQGVDVAEQIIDARATPADLESRVDKLEADVSRLDQERENAAGETTDVDLAELEEKTDSLLYQLELVADFLNEQYDGGLSDYRERRESTAHFEQ